MAETPSDIPLYFAEYVRALEAEKVRLEAIVSDVETYRRTLPYSDVHIREQLRDILDVA